MNPLVSIIPAPDGHFIAQKTTENLAWLSVLIAIGAVIFIVIAIRARFWAFWLAPPVLLLVAAFLYFSGRGVSYRMEIIAHDLHFQTLKNDQIAADSDIHLENIASADIEYQRQNSRIVAVMKDGTVLYPLGEEWTVAEPLQFQVLNAIRQAIGQNPTTRAPQ